MKDKVFKKATAAPYIVNGRQLKPPECYVHNRYWVAAFENTFPAKAEKMREMSNQYGWFADQHYINWFEPCLEWVKKHDKRKRNYRHTKTYD